MTRPVEKTLIMKTTQILLIATAILFGSLTSSAQNNSPAPEAVETEVAAQLVEFRNPVYPLRAKMDGVFSGDLKLLINIDEKGKIVDYLPISASHSYFLKPVEGVIQQWVFLPAMRDGKPVSSLKTIHVNFTPDESVDVRMGPSTTVAFINEARGSGGERVNYIANLRDLDHLPVPLEVSRPITPAEIPLAEREGRMVFEFYIDQAGNVRLPVLIESEGHMLFAESVARTLSTWRFEPPTVNGHPVAVRVRQEFKFSK